MIARKVETTLLKMMVGLIRADEGEIILRDSVVRGIPKNIGFVFQEPALLPWKTVHQNVDLALEAKHLSSEERKAAVEHYLELTGLSAFGAFAPYELSGGMQRRVALARGLVGSPDVLMLDEPFVALDALTRSALQQELATIIHETGTTVPGIIPRCTCGKLGHGPTFAITDPATTVSPIFRDERTCPYRAMNFVPSLSAC